MLPIPDTVVWSSSARLSSVRRRRIPATASSSEKAGSIGSRALCATGSGSSPPPAALTRGCTERPPKVRWSTNRSSGPSSSNAIRIRRCFPAGRSASATSIWPLMPRWASTASAPRAPPSSSSHRYFPRRHAALIVWPARRAAKSSPPATCRRTARGCATSTWAIRRSSTCAARPRRTTSTSGSSGTCFRSPNESALRGGVAGGRLGRQGPPRQLCCLLLGLLLRAAVPRAQRAPPDDRRGGEELRVVRALLGDPVLGHAQVRRGGELLQAGLSIEAGAEQGRRFQQRVEEPVHDRAGGLQPVPQVHGPDQRLGGVGQDAGLRPAAGQLLAAAEVEVGGQAAALRSG